MEYKTNDIEERCGNAIKGLARNISTRLVRFKSEFRSQKCCICLSDQVKGIVCYSQNPHYTCDDCFSKYVASICLSDPGSLLKAGGRINCPARASESCLSLPWASRDVRQILDGNVMDRYIDTLVYFAEKLASNPSGNSGSTKDNIVNALTLKCPNIACATALDPNPDGCSAMQCRMCNTHFCWLCFCIKPGASEAHEHVRLCGENPTPNQLFHEQEITIVVHKRRQVEAIRRVLLASAGVGWQQSEHCREDVQKVSDVLSEANITLGDVFAETSTRPLPETRPNAQDTEQISFVRDIFELVLFGCSLTGYLELSDFVCTSIHCRFGGWFGYCFLYPVAFVLICVVQSFLTSPWLKNFHDSALYSYGIFKRSIWISSKMGLGEMTVFSSFFFFVLLVGLSATVYKDELMKGSDKKYASFFLLCLLLSCFDCYTVGLSSFYEEYFRIDNVSVKTQL